MQPWKTRYVHQCWCGNLLFAVPYVSKELALGQVEELTKFNLATTKLEELDDAIQKKVQEYLIPSCHSDVQDAKELEGSPLNIGISCYEYV